MSEQKYSLVCRRCNGSLKMDSYTIDTFTCQNKHVFYFKCSDCDDFSATAIANIPPSQWPEMMDSDTLNKLSKEYNDALNQHG